MALEIQMPQLGLTMKEGLITEWKKKEGDKVAKGEVIYSVENDKATVDVEAQGVGILARIIVREMVTVPVGTIVGLIAAPGEKLETAAPAAPAKTAPKPAEAKPETSATATMPAAAMTAAPPGDGFVLASPLARQTAESLGIDLARVRGTGPEGAVLGRDLQNTDAIPLAGRGKAAAESRPLPMPSLAQGSEVALTRIQRVAAERMTESWTNIPQFTLYDEADAGMILELAGRFKKEGSPISLTVILAKLLAIAAERQPLLNATWLGGGMVRTYATANVNIAVDTPEGLVVPVLRACASRGFIALGKEMKEIAEKAKAKSLGPEDYEGGTITLSNLGMFGIARFRAIINPPQTAILAVGRISEKVVPGAEGFEARKFIEYSITADHRAVDGAYAARFMASLKALIENPVRAMD